MHAGKPLLFTAENPAERWLAASAAARLGIVRPEKQVYRLEKL
jgi:hypothetical protein